MPGGNLADEIASWSRAEHAVMVVFPLLSFCCGLLAGLGLFGFSVLALLVGSGVGVVLAVGTLVFMTVVRLVVGD